MYLCLLHAPNHYSTLYYNKLSVYLKLTRVYDIDSMKFKCINI